MKKLLLSIAVLVIATSTVFGQSRKNRQINPHNWFIGIGQDVKMSFEGAHGAGGQLNPEIVGGVDFEHWRFSMKYEWYSSIQYRKWTVIAVDYKPRFLLDAIGFGKNWETLIGGEFNVIYRYDSVPDIYDDNWSVGANAETIYWFGDHLGLGAQYNVFTAEAYDNFGNEMKNWRQDVRINLYFKF